ncbi:MAG TPA: HD domain-containing phosphohydrolase [Dehalococcoidia bacterium]|nr:HD domain-containing phosphohydrolase [Dehalococcoidia bacterium]
MQTASEVVLAHHEHFDGAGYPRRLAGEEIPLGARIFAIADAFDA